MSEIELSADSIERLGADPDAPKGEASVAEQTRPFLVFRVGASWHAFPVELIQEVLPYSIPTAVPGVPSLIAGVCNLSGKIAVVLDLKHLPGLTAGPSSGDSSQWRTVVLRVQGLPVAAAVEEIAGLMEIPLSQLRPPLEESSLLRESFLMKEQLVTVLQLDDLLSKAENDLKGSNEPHGLSHHGGGR